MRDVVGKVAVVTGAASGIGKGMAEAFAARGMKVVISDIEKEPLDRALQSLQAADAQAHAVVADVSNPEHVQHLASETMRVFGGVHVLCNNAGIMVYGRSSWESTLDDWRWNLDVNLMGVVHGVQAFVPIMIAQAEDAHIVNTASLAALLPTENTLYSTGKAALLAFSESLSLELKRAAPRISVSVLCPAFVNTNILDSARNRPQHLADGGSNRRDEKSEVEHWIRAGMEPRAVGEQVLLGILEERFYIHTHPEVMPYVERRFDALVAGARPGTL